MSVLTSYRAQHSVKVCKALAEVACISTTPKTAKKAAEQSQGAAMQILLYVVKKGVVMLQLSSVCGSKLRMRDDNFYFTMNHHR